MILERYIQREILEKLGWIIGVLVLILTSKRFVDYLADAAVGKLPSDLILDMLTMKMLAILPRLLPIAIFLSVIIALTRMAQDKELTIVSSAGITLGFQFTSIFHFSLVYAFFVFLFSFYISPWAEGNVQNLKERAKVESDVSGMSSGQFKEFSQGDQVVYVEQLSADKESMENVFLQVRQERGLAVLHSNTARYKYSDISGSRYILFQNGQRYIGSPGTLDYRITRYRTYAVLMEEAVQDVAASRVEAVPTSRLFGSDRALYKAELQWRLSYVLAALLLPLLAAALNRFAFSEKRYTFIFVAILIYFIYSNLLGISKTMLKRDNISPYIGLWWVHLLLVLLILLIINLPLIKIKIKSLINKHRKTSRA